MTQGGYIYSFKKSPPVSSWQTTTSVRPAWSWSPRVCLHLVHLHSPGVGHPTIGRRIPGAPPASGPTPETVKWHMVIEDILRDNGYSFDLGWSFIDSKFETLCVGRWRRELTMPLLSACWDYGLKHGGIDWVDISYIAGCKWQLPYSNTEITSIYWSCGSPYSGRQIICAHKSRSSAHTATDHVHTQISIISAHRSGSSAHTHQNTKPKQLCQVGWGGVGWGGDDSKPCRCTRTWQLHRADFPFYQHLLTGGMGWGGVGIITTLYPDLTNTQGRLSFLPTSYHGWDGVGWGGDNNKPCRLTRTWQIHRADFPFYQHLIMGGMGWGGVGIITNLAAVPGPDNYTRQTFLSTNILSWVGWGGVGWGQ